MRPLLPKIATGATPPLNLTPSRGLSSGTCHACGMMPDLITVSDVSLVMPLFQSHG